jgi:FkbM family methyltransferase
MHQSLGVSVLYLFFLKIYWYLFAGQTRTKLLRLKFKGTPFTFYADNRLDLGTLEDIFVKQDYSFNYIGNPKIILDIGANIGDTAIFYSILFPGAQIFAIEPNPSVHERLGLNTAQFPNIKICKCAVADTTGKIDLFVGGSHLGSSIKAREQNTQSISVDVFSLEDFCKMQNLSKVDILKFDIEGAEENLLKSSFMIKSLM